MFFNWLLTQKGQHAVEWLERIYILSLHVIYVLLHFLLVQSVRQP